MQELCVHTISCVFEACKDFYHLNFCQVETEYKVKSGWNFESIFILFLILKKKSKRDLKDACAILHDLYFHWWCQWRCFGSNHYVYNDDNSWVSSRKVKTRIHTNLYVLTYKSLDYSIKVVIIDPLLDIRIYYELSV